MPIYQTASAEEAEHVLKDSESRVVFCEDTEKLETAREAAEGLDHVEHYVLFEGEADGAITLDELRERGRDKGDQVDERTGAVERDDVFTLIYTSGTTGPPKGCVLTHGNYRADCEALEQVAQLEDDAVFYIFLPLAHALTRMTQMAVLDVGATLAFWQRDKDKALEDLKEIAPTHFPSVPRVFEKIYEEARRARPTARSRASCSTRRSTSAARCASSSARARSPASRSSRSTTSPTSRSCRRCATCSAASSCTR